MKDLETRIETLTEVMEAWLNPDNEWLHGAIDRTVSEGYFSFPDVKHSVLALREGCSAAAIREWVERSGITDDADARGDTVLCLHAGNLPLVGFQDAFATLLSGARYTGKISRKDPYLLPTFLNEVKKTETWSGVDVQWSHRLDDFEGMRHDAVLFAGSEQSVSGVKEALERYELADDDTRMLIRTAHFSMAYLDSKEPVHMEELTEAIFRYGGKGCRSVAVVVSPFSLDEIKCELTDYIESFWLENPQFQKPKPKLKQRFAYNKAVERSQAWLDDFLLQQDGLELDQDFICYWVEGDEERTAELADALSGNGQLQSIYITNPDSEISGFEDRVEFLSDAQQPPVYWKPDGTDVLKWLSK